MQLNNSAVLGLLGLIVFIFFILAYGRKLWRSIRNRGMSASTTLIVIKIKAVLELFIQPIIWGDKVGLRSTKSSLSDAQIEQVYELSRDEEVLRWSGGVRSEQSLDEFRDQIRRERWHFQTNQRLLYILSRENEIIGRVGLYTIDWEKREGEFGISINKKYWNKKYGRDATDLLIGYIFTQTPIRRIYLGTFQDNIRAQRSFAASGFRVVGTATRILPGESSPVNGIEMEITLQEWKK
jgi:RimJ/RimL family protein N-acetyltransferase